LNPSVFLRVKQSLLSVLAESLVFSDHCRAFLYQLAWREPHLFRGDRLYIQHGANLFSVAKRDERRHKRLTCSTRLRDCRITAERGSTCLKTDATRQVSLRNASAWAFRLPFRLSSALGAVMRGVWESPWRRLNDVHEGKLLFSFLSRLSFSFFSSSSLLFIPVILSYILSSFIPLFSPFKPCPLQSSPPPRNTSTKMASAPITSKPVLR